MEDDRAVFRLHQTPTLGVPVFSLGYRELAPRLPWYRRWWQWLRRLLHV